MYLDFKVTAWERVFVPDNLKQELLKQLKDGKILSSNDVLDLEDSTGIYFNGMIAGTEEQMIPEEQDGFSTIELLIDDGEKPLFKNGK